MTCFFWIIQRTHTIVEERILFLILQYYPHQVIVKNRIPLFPYIGRNICRLDINYRAIQWSCLYPLCIVLTWLKVVISINGIKQSSFTFSVDANKYVDIFMNLMPTDIILIPQVVVFKILYIVHFYVYLLIKDIFVLTTC